MMCDLTIIVPVYKIKEEFLRQCIESLLNQGCENYHVILVDAGSPDNCGKICDEYAEKSPLVTVVHQQNQGVSVARNNAISMVSTKWLTFIDADDWIEKDYVQKISAIAAGDAEAADLIMYEYRREFSSSSSRESLNVPDGYLNHDTMETCRKAVFYKLLQDGKLNSYTVIGLWNKLYRTEFIRKNHISFVPEARKGQDRLFNAEALLCAERIYYLNEAFYHYRCWGDSRTNRFDTKIVDLTRIEIESLQKVIEKYKLSQEYKDYINCRICTRLYACMRLYVFNPENPQKRREQIAAAKQIVWSEPFGDALQVVKTDLLTSQERLFVFCIQKKLYNLLYLLVKLKSGAFARKLS